MYTIGKIKVRRADKRRLELEIDGKKAKVFTEDLACLVREELPKDRAQELFAEIEERALTKGKARVIVRAEKDIRKGQEVCFTLDITKYQDGSGVRATKSGIIF